ncbi:MAG: hypothetical protein VZS44_07410 [Bacilli bacterium]|nr:hypothetical protein [Bacilli bacterium]
MLEIQSSKIVLTLVDTETGELFTKEATFGDFKEATKKTTSTRSKKPKDTDPVAKITLLEGKWQMNAACVELTGFEPEQKLEIKFEKKGRVITPVLCEDEKSGNRLTKTYTVSCRGSKHDNLAEYGDIFEVIPYEGKEGYFKLKGNIEKEDDIIDVPEEITDPDEIDEDVIDDSEVDISDFDLEL